MQLLGIFDATSIWGSALKPSGSERRFLRVTDEWNTLLSVWGIDQRAENEELSVGTTVAVNTVLQKRCMKLSAKVVNRVEENRADSSSMMEKTFLESEERSSPTTGSEGTQVDLEVAGKIPGTILRLRGGGSKPRKRTKKGMRPPGKRRRVGKNEKDTTIEIATKRSPADSDFERQCLLGKAELVKDYRNELNLVLVGMNIDMDWAMF